jgi:hypothetical protein
MTGTDILVTVDFLQELGFLQEPGFLNQDVVSFYLLLSVNQLCEHRLSKGRLLVIVYKSDMIAANSLTD